MKKENVIDLATYREERQQKPANSDGNNTISEELKTAIEDLIERMRTQDTEL